MQSGSLLESRRPNPLAASRGVSMSAAVHPADQNPWLFMVGIQAQGFGGLHVDSRARVSISERDRIVSLPLFGHGLHDHVVTDLVRHGIGDHTALSEPIVVEI